MNTIIIIAAIWIVGVVLSAAFLAWREPWAENNMTAVAIAWLWPFVVIATLGWMLGDLISWLTNRRA